MAMHNAVLLASENTDLRTANQKQKQKREMPRVYIANGGILTAQEGLCRAETRVVADAEDLWPSDTQPKNAPSRCRRDVGGKMVEYVSLSATELK